MTKHTILFLAANPSGIDRRALDREAHSIQAELERGAYRDRFEFETRWAPQPLDLLRELRALRPTVVHFSGRGCQNGLFFLTENGRATVVSPATIAQTFGAAGASVKLVVLSGCYSEATADALLAHIDCNVGMDSSIHDDAARTFAIGFYGALGQHESIAAAYQHGRAAIGLEGLPDVDCPQLKIRDGFDPARFIPAATAPAVRVALPCPYPGMRSYSGNDTEHFHGRGAEIDEMLARLRAGEREIYVIGPSGSGKSSLVAAGVLPRLARTRIVTASSDHTARIWSAVDGKLLSTPLEHQGPVWNAAFSPDGTRVITASDARTARIWDVDTGKPLDAPLQHQGVVWSAAFSPGGNRVVTASFDNTARIWDAATGKLLVAPLEHQPGMYGARPDQL